MNIFKRLFGARAQYYMIIASGEDQKEKSKRLGIQSIILSVIGLVAVLVFVSLGTVTAANVTAEGTAPITSLPCLTRLNEQSD